MATSLTFLPKLLNQQSRLVYLICTRGSRYDKSFIDNTKSLEEIQKSVPDDDTRRNYKIKAALTDDHTFTNYDPLVQKFINMVMEHGKKELASDLVYKALVDVKRHQVQKYHKTTDTLEKSQLELDPFIVFRKALENGMPKMHLKRVLVAGTKLQVPVACSEERGMFYSMKWLALVSNSKSRDRKFHDQLATEIISAYNHGGGLIRKKQELHKLCEANKAYAHMA